MNRFLLLLALLLAGAGVLSGATDVTADITTDTTWNAAGSPYRLSNPSIFLGDITIRNGATLTIDTTSGAVSVEWTGTVFSTDFDLVVGNGSSEQGTLVIKAVSGAVDFKVRTGGNIRVKDNGQLRWASTNAATSITRYDGSNTWGALIFEAGQTRQSEVKKSTFSYGGNDSKTAMIVVEDSETYVPYLENLTFSNQAVSNSAAIRFNGKGVNTLKEDNVVPPFSVSSVDYVFYVNAVTSTAASIRFPDVDSPDSPVNYLAGTCTVGDSSNVSHWRFDDGYTFKCANSSLITVTRGSIWGTVETRPEFRSVNASPTYSNWTGLRDNGTTYDNMFGGIGPFAFVTVRDATYGVDVDKYHVSASPIAGKTMRLPGIKANHCTNGVRLKGPMTGAIALESADLGHASSSAEYNNSRCVEITAGDVHLLDCDMRGVAASGGTRVVSVGGGSLQYDLYMRDCRFGGQGSHAIYLGDAVTRGDATIERCSVAGTYATNTVYLYCGNNVARDLTIRNSLLGGYASVSLNEWGASTPTITVLIEDTTFADDPAGASYGLYGADVPASPSSVTCRRCTFFGRTYGAYLANDSTNLCEYTFEECWFNDNTNGIYDARTQTARCVAAHCSFQGNSSYAAYDASGGSASTDMLAESCYWNSPTGPSAGPGLDDVSSNVDYSPYLGSAYFDTLIGGSPAGASMFEVRETATTRGDHLHIIAHRPYFAWQFGSDFGGATQSAYEVEVSSSPAFGSFMWNGSKTVSNATNVQYPATGGGVSALVDGTLYFARIRLWDQNDRHGAWHYRVFRMNTTPAAPGSTDRSPGALYSGALPAYEDHTPIYQWQRPTDSDEDPLHFIVEVGDKHREGEKLFWSDTDEPITYRSDVTPELFQISTDAGATWLPFPLDGVPSSSDAILVRLVTPNAEALIDDTWFWQVSATDGFEAGPLSELWGFELGRKYTISGQLSDPAGLGSGISSQTVKIAKGGAVLGTSAMTDGSGNFSLANMTDDLRAGDIVVLFIDNNGATDTATLVQFAGDDMTAASGQFAKVNLELGRAIADTRFPTPLSNADFASDSATDADIPWSEASGTVTFDSGIAGSNRGLRLKGTWALTGIATGSAASVEIHVESTGTLLTDGYDTSFNTLVNVGHLRVTKESVFTIDGGNSTSGGTLFVCDSTFRLKKSGGLSLTISNGVCELVRAELDVDTGDVSSLVVDSGASQLAVLSCSDSSFSKVGLVVEADGVVAQFNGITFEDGISTRHIYWKTTDPRSTRVMRGIQFDYALTQGSQFNVEADASAIALQMIGCGGVRWGEGYDKDGGSEGDALDDLVLWELTPPTDLKITAGDTRMRLEWSASDQAALTNAGYNVYRTTNPADSVPWGSPLNGGTPLTAISYDDSSLSNGTTYYYYVTVIDTNPTPDAESGGSNRVNAAPVASEIDEIAPASTAATSVLALTVLGENTHWTSAMSITITKSGGSEVTVNDKVVISSELVLVDVTLSGATTGTWTVTTTENDVWGISAYDEVETADLTVTADDPDESDRPTLVFSTNNSGIAADANTSGAFVLNIDFTDNGNGIDTTKFEAFVSRDFAAYFGGGTSNITPDMEIVAAGIVIETLNDSRATWTVEQVATMNGEEMFDDGEHTVYARVADDDGNYSEWTTLRFYVEGAAADVAKTTTLLYQGDTAVNVVISGTFSTTVDGVDFGTGITTVSYRKDSGTQVTATVTVDETAACGPRTFTVDMATGTDPAGIVVVEYPTNILPTTTNAEPSRNPAVGGINVFLANGAFFKSETDIATRGRMMGMSWSRFYRSDIAFNGPLGHNWVGHYFQRAYFYAGGMNHVYWYTPDGRLEDFVGDSLDAPAGVYVRATVESTHINVTLTDRHGYRCVFNSNGRLWKCIDRNGNFTECTYNNLGQLVGITDDLGRAWEIEYYDHGRVHKVIDKVWDTSTPREIEYVYDSNGDLTEQKAPTTARYDGTPLARVTYGYGYDSAHRLTKCINPREFAQSANPVPYLENFYDSTGRVVDQKLGDEADVQDSHLTRSAFIRLRYESGTLIRELDRNGLRTDYTIDASGRATDIKRYTAFWSVDTDYPYTHSTVSQVVAKLRSTDPSYFQTVLTYNSNHEVLTVTYPRGNKVTYTYPSGSSQAAATADSCSGAVLTDSGESWTTDEFAGMTLRMGTSAANYRYYPIASNTSNTITVETGFDLQADGWDDDAYAVYDESNDPLAAGNVVSVTRSDEGLGSLLDIVTNYTYEPRYQFVKTVSDPRNSAWLTTYTYDYEESAANGLDAGNLVKVETPTITGSMASNGTIVSRTTYNQYGQPVTSIDGKGNIARFDYYSSGDNDGFLKQRISAWGELNLTSEYAYDKVGNLTASWPPRAFESGVTKDDFKFSAEVNELNQTWHTTSKVEVGTAGALTLVGVDSYNYFDANGNRTHSFHEYVTAAGTGKTNPSGGDELNPDWFDGQKATTAMAATWVESSATYNLLNYTVTSTRDAIAGSAITQFTTRVEHDSNYNTLARITPLGNRTHTVYDERDMVYRRIPGANSDVQATFEVDYDANGNTLKSRDALGNESVNVYDGFDRLTKSTDPAGHYRELDYDAANNTTETRAYDKFALLLAKGQTTFDEINRVYISKRRANDHNGAPIGDGWSTNTTVFDKNSRVVSSTNDNGVTHFMVYDGANRTTFTRDAVGNETHFEYNANGATKKINYREINGLDNSVEISHTENILTKQDSVVEHRDRRYASGTFDTSTKSMYDGWGRVTESTDSDGTDTVYEYDLLSRQTRTTRMPSATSTTWIVSERVYDDDSRVVKTRISKNPNTNSSWQETHFEHDERSRVITRRAPDGDIWTYKFDANGNVTERNDPLGTKVVTTYDARNLPAYRNITRGTGIVGPTYESYEYDGLGRMQSCSNYDGANLIAASAMQFNTLSLAERYDQTVASSEGNILGTNTIKAEYDGTGFRTKCTYWDGREVTHTPDALNRLLTTYDQTNSTNIANYLYAGPNRVIERTYGNGTRTTYEYESSGCGCGGSTAFVDRVEHTHLASSDVLFAVDRRYDITGNLTAERFGHEGDLGVVYRRDDTYRLTDTFYGVDLSSTALATYANPANTPTVFGLNRQYTLDPRSNRSSVLDEDDSSTTVYDYTYSLSTDDNDLYTDVDGDNYSYDAIEQRTYDDATGLYYAYDYRGYLWLVDTDSNLATPEQVYHHDCMGNRVLEEGWYDDDEPTNVHKTVLVNDIKGGGCAGNGEAKAGEVRYDDEDAETGSVQYIYGKGMGSLVHELAANGVTTIHRFRHEDQAGSLIGVTDEDGLRTDEYFYLDFGTPIHRPIAFDGNTSRISSIAANTPVFGVTRITLTGVSLTADVFNGKQMRAIGSLHIGEVYDTGTSTIEVYDLDDQIYDAIDNGSGFVVLDFTSPRPAAKDQGTWDDVIYMGGPNETVFVDNSASFLSTVDVGDLVLLRGLTLPAEWVAIDEVRSNGELVIYSGDYSALSATGQPYEVQPPSHWTYDGGSDTSTYTNGNAGFEDYMVGWLFTPNVHKPAYLQVVAVDDTAGEITVKGDARGLEITPVDDWRIQAPPGVDSGTGALHTDLTHIGSRCLLGRARYMPPQVGFSVMGTIEGAQTGPMLNVTYYCDYGSYDSTLGSAFTLQERLANLATDGSDNNNRAPHLLQANPRPVRGPTAVARGEVEVYDFDTSGRKGYRVRYKTQNPGDARDCKWIQFAITSIYVRTRYTYSIDGHHGERGEIESDWTQAKNLATEALNTTANGGKPINADGETAYVDSPADNGQGPMPAGASGPPQGNNDPGYVEGKNNEGKHGAGTSGASGTRDLAEAIDAPGWDSVQNAKDWVDRIKAEVDKNAKKPNAFQATRPQVFAVKLRVDFTIYLVCNDRVEASMNWWWEGVYNYDNNTVSYSKGISGGPGAAGVFEDKHKRALEDWKKGQRNGAK